MNNRVIPVFDDKVWDKVKSLDPASTVCDIPECYGDYKRKEGEPDFSFEHFNAKVESSVSKGFVTRVYIEPQNQAAEGFYTFGEWRTRFEAWKTQNPQSFLAKPENSTKFTIQNIYDYLNTTPGQTAKADYEAACGSEKLYHDNERLYRIEKVKAADNKSVKEVFYRLSDEKQLSPILSAIALSTEQHILKQATEQHKSKDQKKELEPDLGAIEAHISSSAIYFLSLFTAERNVHHHIMLTHSSRTQAMYYVEQQAGTKDSPFSKYLPKSVICLKPNYINVMNNIVTNDIKSHDQKIASNQTAKRIIPPVAVQGDERISAPMPINVYGKRSHSPERNYSPGRTSSPSSTEISPTASPTIPGSPPRSPSPTSTASMMEKLAERLLYRVADKAMREEQERNQSWTHFDMGKTAAEVAKGFIAGWNRPAETYEDLMTHEQRIAYKAHIARGSVYTVEAVVETTTTSEPDYKPQLQPVSS